MPRWAVIPRPLADLRASGLWPRGLNAALDFLFPPSCAACSAGGAHLCDVCRDELRPASGQRCRVCWAPGGASPCIACQEEPPAFDALRAAFVYEGATRDAVLALKYAGMRSVAAALLDAALVEGNGSLVVGGAARGIDFVTAVPMAARRRRRRGYNQAEVLARLVAGRLERPFEAGLLERARGTEQQARQADLQARRTNVRGAFRADAALAKGRRILVVDDVTTSGATLNACAEALLAAGATSVLVWALARED